MSNVINVQKPQLAISIAPIRSNIDATPRQTLVDAGKKKALLMQTLQKQMSMLKQRFWFTKPITAHKQVFLNN